MPKLNFVKKISLIILSSLLFLNSMAMPFAVAKAADEEPSTWYNQGFGMWYSKVYGNESQPSEIFGERYTAAQVQWIIYGLFAYVINTVTSPEIASCILSSGTDLTPCAQLLTDSNQNVNSVAIFDNLENQDTKILGLVFADRSFSGIRYIKNKFQSFNLIPETQAQTEGFGFNALEVVQDMWSASRNVAFGFFVLASVIFSFMIMFRVKISPQVVISVQSAIPKMVVALILVTFSYAIAGFLVDLMYVIYGILGIILKSFTPAINPSVEQMFNFLVGGRIFGFSFDLGILGLVVLYAISFSLGFALTLFSTVGAVISIFGLVITSFVAIMIPTVGGLLTTIAVLLFVAIIIFLIWIIIKVIFSLLKAYVNILLLTVFAPLQIVVGVFIPSFGFSAWIKSFSSNLAVFVLTSVMFYLSFMFLLLGTVTGLNAIAGTGPFSEFIIKMLAGTAAISGVVATKQPAGWPPLIGGAEGMLGLLLISVSFVIFSTIPKANEIIQSFISGKPFSYGSAIGEAIAPITKSAGPGVLLYEEARRKTMGIKYSESLVKQLARSFGVVK